MNKTKIKSSNHVKNVLTPLSMSPSLVQYQKIFTIDASNTDRPSIQHVLISDNKRSSSSLDSVYPCGYIECDYMEERKEGKEKEKEEANKAELIYKQAMSLATAPGKQLFMTCFMLWMSGSSLQIFSIMMLCMALWQPIGKLLNVHQEFARYSESSANLLVPKLVFIALNLVGLGVALYKCQTMGLLPTSRVDWLNTHIRQNVEYSYGGGAIL